jgi:hypothetical protein
MLGIKPYTAHWLYALLPAFLSQLHWIKQMSEMTWSSTSQLRAPPPREVCEVISYITKKQFKLNEQKENDTSRKALTSSCEIDYTSYNHFLCSSGCSDLIIRLLGLNAHLVIISIEKSTIDSDSRIFAGLIATLSR